MATTRTQCERCKDWERMGLSAYCPSCDAVWLAELEAKADVRRAESALADFEANGGTSFEDLKRELGLE